VSQACGNDSLSDFIRKAVLEKARDIVLVNDDIDGESLEEILLNDGM